MARLTESDVEDLALSWLEETGWRTAYGPDLGPDGPNAERSYWGDIILQSRLRDALGRLNPQLPPDSLRDALHRLLAPEGASLEVRNRFVHRALVHGVTVEYGLANGAIRGAQVRILDYEHPEANDWLAVNQLPVREDRQHLRRPDIVLFVNGLPLAVMELKNPTDAQATLWTAYQQLQTYKNEIPSLFQANQLLVVSDGAEARVGTLTAGREWFKPWRSIGDEREEPTTRPELEVVIRGVFDLRRFLDLLHDFIVFDDAGGRLSKKMAGYHQFHAVHAAVRETLRASQLQQSASPGQDRRGGKPGDRRIGVVWHTQGSGKSLTMAFYAGKVIREPGMGNPTIVLLTDRNDLDKQLFDNFARWQDVLGQPPVQAGTRADLRRFLQRESGGVIFTTIQKFLPDVKGDRHPRLSDRRNIVVMADEAHRSQYDFVDGLAKHLRDALPHASFIGFTGTPLEREDANTRNVFGDYISIYDIQQAVEDGATVPIYYEGRLAKMALDEAERPRIDLTFEEVTEDEEVDRKERLKTKWAQLEAVVGSGRRLQEIAQDIVAHFERRLEALDGKGMIVVMSRRIAVELYKEIVRLRADWHGESDEDGALKVVMTGSASDPTDWQGHIRNKARREALATRFKDPTDRLRLVIVRDMWLTGFDAPSLHTMYLDKPMRGHGLMQTIARVNRVFRDKPGGLVVDYLGLAYELKQALGVYTDSGGRGTTAIDQEQVLAALRERYEVCCGILHGFDWAPWHGDNSDVKLHLLLEAQEHILALRDGKERFLPAVQALSRLFALAVPHEAALSIRDDLAFFQAVRGRLAKYSYGGTRADIDVEQAIRQLVSRAVVPGGVLDIFEAAGLGKPDISILADEFLAEVRAMSRKNLAAEVLRKLLEGEIARRGRKNLLTERSFKDMLEAAIARYHNRAIEATALIEELIALAKALREADRRGEQLGLTEDELAFYDALETNDSAVKVLGDETLRAIAQELVQAVRANVSIDWTVRENVRARLRSQIRRVLRRHGYPPDKQERATQTVLEQTEALADAWVEESE